MLFPIPLSNIQKVILKNYNINYFCFTWLKQKLVFILIDCDFIKMLVAAVEN